MTDWGQFLIPLLSLFPLWYPYSSQKCHRPGLPLASWFNPFLLLESLPRPVLALCSGVRWEGREGSLLWTMGSQCMELWMWRNSLVHWPVQLLWAFPPLVKTWQDSQMACRSCFRMHTVSTLDGLELIKAWLLWHLITKTKAFPLIVGFEPRASWLPGEHYATDLQPQLCFEFLFETKSH